MVEDQATAHQASKSSCTYRRVRLDGDLPNVWIQHANVLFVDTLRVGWLLKSGCRGTCRSWDQFRYGGFPSRSIVIETVTENILQTWVNMMCVDPIGRRRVLVYTVWGMAAGLLAVAIAFSFIPIDDINDRGPYGCPVGFECYSACVPPIDDCFNTRPMSKHSVCSTFWNTFCPVFCLLLPAMYPRDH